MPRGRPKNAEKGEFKAGAKQVETARKGGIASGVAKRKKKAIAEVAEIMLAQKMQGDGAKKLKKMYPTMEDEDITVSAGILAAQVNAAIKGDSKAASYLIEMSETAREKREREERKNEKYFMDLRHIPVSFHGLVISAERGDYRQYVVEGGRASMKSSTIGQTFIDLMKQNPEIHGLALRDVGATIKDSVYSKLLWAIDKMGLTEEFICTKSPLEITRVSTGQKIYFRGADDPGKLKSIAPPFGYIGILWFEELDQFAGPEAVRNIEQSAIRGGEKAWIFKSFNPPIQKNNWANKYAAEPQEGKLVHFSTYTMLTAFEQEWLGQPFIEEAEHLKATNPTAYDHEYGGVAVGLGTEIFPFLEIRTITDEEINRMERIYQGQDWGWSPDPKAFIRLSYSHATETIYLIDEDGGTCIRTKDMAKRIIAKGYNDYEVRCGVDEPEHTNDFIDAGLLAREAIVTPGSVKRTHEWLQCRKIVVDPARTPRAYKELTEYAHDVDPRTGEVIDGYPDRNNHWIDAIRYATSPLSMIRGESA